MLLLESCGSKVITKERGSRRTFGDGRERGSTWLPEVGALVLGLFLLCYPGVNRGTEVHLENIAVHLIGTVVLRHARWKQSLTPHGTEVVR